MNRVLIYTPIYPPISGGASSYFHNLAKSLEPEYDVTIMTTMAPDHPYITTTQGTAVYRVIPQLRSLPFPIRAVIVSFVALLLTTILLLIRGIDVVHTHSTSVAVPGIALSSYITGVPLLYDCRDEEFPKHLMKFGNVRGWFSCSSNIDRRLVEAGVPEQSIRRIPVVNPKYVGNFASNEESEDFTVVYIGAIRKRKGVDVAINAFRRFTEDHPRSELIIVGEGPARKRLQRRITKDEYHGNIRFTGAVPHEDALVILGNADVLVLPSMSEGIPRVILEAFELGIPVIASPRGGIPDIVDHEETGLLVEPTTDAVADALALLYKSQDLQSYLTKNAKRVTECRDWEIVVDRIKVEYERVLD